MIVECSAIENGKFLDKFGKRGTQFNSLGMCTYSPEIVISEAPAKTKSYALILEDRDAIPLDGFSWIHWTVANVRKDEIAENESIKGTLLQGATTWSAGKPEDRLESAVYGGMAPPDCDHVYRLAVYALDAVLDLEQGFYANELYKVMKGHVLDKKVLEAIYEF